jgi:hypothetical protein
MLSTGGQQVAGLSMMLSACCVLELGTPGRTIACLDMCNNIFTVLPVL